METVDQTTEIVKALRAARGKRPDEIDRLLAGEPKGLPETPTNSEGTPSGAYSGESLDDPGIVGGVTGSGSGPALR